MSSLTMRRSPAARSSGGIAGDEPVAITARPKAMRVRAVDVERAVVDEAGVAADAVGLGNRLDAVEHEADEAVALALDARHHRPAVDRDRAFEAQAELRPLLRGACAASAAAISSLLGMQPTRAQVVPYGPALDDDGAPAGGDRGAIRGEPGGAGADDGDIDGDCFMIPWS